MSFRNFGQCLASVQANPTLWRTGGTDASGNLVDDASRAVGLTYSMCVSQCGSAPMPFSFETFSTQFSSFMLPFLALTAQLPFSAPNRFDNFATIMLTIGSPTLGIFSLMITIFNSRWIKWRFARIAYPNSDQAVIVLDNLQGSLLRVKQRSFDGRLPLLAAQIVLPQNDQWWQRGAATLAFTQTWSISNIASVCWAIIAYIFTIVSANNGMGFAVACAWIWLLPLVVGWLQTSPNCDEVKLRAKVATLNETAYISCYRDLAPTSATGGSTRRENICQWLSELTKPIDWDTFDESRSPPFYNYARMFSWARSVEEIAVAFEAASIRASKRQTVNGSLWKPSTPGSTSVFPCNRIGKAEEVVIYILPEGQPQLHDKCWAPGVWRRVSYSAIVASAVQWSCTGSAVLVAWMIPTVGLGCHSASFLLHGSLSMISFTMILAGEIITQCHRTINPQSHSLSSPSHIRHVNLSALCRRIIAWVNACMFIALGLIGFANLFDNCFCSSAVMSRGVHNAFNVIVVEGEGAKPVMIACVAFATTAAFSLWIIVFILRTPKKTSIGTI
ncbi:hypothetical protein B0H13DRAFT_1623304 [Mycena leptocephala]|nr:hypothetical protein B0H13DRAFT_1623304 [Mycena leptocephala]